MDDREIGDVLAAAADGDQDAWDAIVARFERLVWVSVRSFRLPRPAADDVTQTVWLRLVENLDRIRDPERLGGWLATTARRESLRYVTNADRVRPTDQDDVFDRQAADVPGSIDGLVQEERTTAVHRALRRISPHCRQLLTLLQIDPPLPYEAIAASLGRPIGSLGPTRARCIEHLRAILREDGHEIA